MSIQQIKERLSQGWNWNDAIMGRGWQTKYPHIAAWRSSYGIAGSAGDWRIWLEATCGSEFVSFHTTTYVLAEKIVARTEGDDGYRIVDEFIRNWVEEHGLETLRRFQKGWIGEIGWEARYPHIAHWIRQGKRHCIRIEINLVTHHSRVKAWHYDKPTNTETVLFEREVENWPEAEVLQILDVGIESWLREG